MPPPEAEEALERSVRDFLEKYPRPFNYHADEWRAECRSEAWSVFPDILRTYNPAKGEQEGYVYRAVQNHLLNYLHREKRWRRHHAMLLDELAVDAEGEEHKQEVVDEATIRLEEELCQWLTLCHALALLDKMDRYLVQEVWVRKRPQAEVAQELQKKGVQLSQQAISRRLNRVKRFLREQLEGG